jgi:hypothetical protein
LAKTEKANKLFDQLNSSINKFTEVKKEFNKDVIKPSFV